VTGVAEATDRRKLPMTVSDCRRRPTAGRCRAVRPCKRSKARWPVCGWFRIRRSPGASRRCGCGARRASAARQDPLIIVDGVITRFGLADISGEDVERVEIRKGPQLPRRCTAPMRRTAWCRCSRSAGIARVSHHRTDIAAGRNGTSVAAVSRAATSLRPPARAARHATCSD